jgi:simple sugar transport system ATP-binding protein
MRELKEGGRSIVFISHKLKEVKAVADTITVLRRGKVVGQRPPGTAEEELASLMVGRAVQLQVTKSAARAGDVALDVRALTAGRGHTGGALGGGDGSASAPTHAGMAVDQVSFQVRAGEILGVAGVQGNGQTELCEALLGLRPVVGGSVHILGRDVTRATTRERLHAGVGYIPEDRQRDGLVGMFSVAENLILDTYSQPPYARGLALDVAKVKETAAARVAEYDVRTTSVATPVATLSGGNQQKVILAREVGREVKLLVANQPTRGLDVGSIEFVHRRIIEERDRGVAVLIVSSELDEVYALADRIAVMYEGKITGFRAPTVSVAELGLLMAGGGTGAPAEPGNAAAPEPAEPPDSDDGAFTVTRPT